MIKKLFFFFVLVISLTACQQAKQSLPLPETTNNSTQQQSTNEFTFTAQEENLTALMLTQTSAEMHGKEYPGIGVMVTTINGITPPEGKFWALYHNGEKAKEGAVQLMLQKGDTITWKIENVQ